MHAAAQTIAEKAAIGTLALTGPGAVAEGLITFVPYGPQVVVVDVALAEVATDAGAG